MPGVRRLPSGKLQGWYFDALGRRRYWTSEDPRATVKQVRAIVSRLEDDHRQVSLGYRPATTAADRSRSRPFIELAAEYMEWGTSQGGIGGRPWPQSHVKQRRALLDWWRTRLGLEVVGDLEGTLPRVEAALRELLSTRSGCTVANYTTALRAMCRWAQQRGYLEHDPLQGMAPVNTTPKRQRRALTQDELTRLLAAAPPERRLVYQVAVASGLRANELRSLTGADLDLERGGLTLRGEWTKNRQSGFQPLPEALMAELAAVRPANPADRLLAVQQHQVRPLDRDLEAAGILKWTPGGVVDFHSLRVTYVTLLVEMSAASVREAQVLARHATPALTMGTYAKVRDAGLRAAVERIGTAVGVTKLTISCAPGVHEAAGSDPASGPTDCRPITSAGR